MLRPSLTQPLPPKAPKSTAGSLRLCAALLLLAACRDTSAAPVHVVLGPQPSDELTLVPVASLAEFVELSSTESALLITLTSVERSCDKLPTDDPQSVAIALRITLPGGAQLAPGVYPVAPGPPEKPHASGSVRRAGMRHELRPGGEIELKQLDLNPQGVVEGLLKLEAPGDAEHPATHVAGRFSAHFCRINRLR